MVALMIALACAPTPLAAASSASCVDCHAGPAAEWANSVHAWGRRDPVYAIAVAEAFDPGWCDGCHLPDGSSVGCVVCHVDAAGLIRASVVTPEGQAAHPTRLDPGLGTDGCLACHQIDPPPHQPGGARGGVPLQATGDEWRAAGAQHGCADCHMGTHGHRMPGAHDAAMREHLSVSVAATAERVAVRLAARGVGHAAPTGDAFHHVEVAVGRGEGCDQAVVARFARVLGTHDEQLIVLADRRIPAGDVERVLRLPRPPEATHWCARYVFADLRHEGLVPDDAFAAPMGGGPLYDRPR